MTCTKGPHESQRENSRAEQGLWKDMALDGLPMIDASAASLINNRENSQSPSSEI